MATSSRPASSGGRRVAGWFRAVAMAVSVAVVALLVHLSVAPRVQPSDTFQVKPRAVKQQVHGAEYADATLSLGPGAHGGGPGAALAAPGVRPAPDLTGAFARSAPVHTLTARAPGSHGCRGPPLAHLLAI